MSLLSLPRTERRTRSSCQSFPRAFILRTSFFWVSELMLKIRPAKSPLFIWVGVACHAQQVCVQRKAALTAEVRHYLYSPVFCVYTAALIKQPENSSLHFRTRALCDCSSVSTVINIIAHIQGFDPTHTSIKLLERPRIR